MRRSKTGGGAPLARSRRALCGTVGRVVPPAHLRHRPVFSSGRSAGIISSGGGVENRCSALNVLHRYAEAASACARHCSSSPISLSRGTTSRYRGGTEVSAQNCEMAHQALPSLTTPNTCLGEERARGRAVDSRTHQSRITFTGWNVRSIFLMK